MASPRKSAVPSSALIRSRQEAWRRYRPSAVRNETHPASASPGTASNVAAARASNPAYAALPAGTYWRIGENAHLAFNDPPADFDAVEHVSRALAEVRDAVSGYRQVSCAQALAEVAPRVAVDRITTLTPLAAAMLRPKPRRRAAIAGWPPR